MARYIDADKLINNIKQNIICLSDDGEQAKDTIIRFIGDEIYNPSADVEPVKRGKWISEEKIPTEDMDGLELKELVCGNCKRYVYAERDDKYNYCPICGAKMEGDAQ